MAELGALYAAGCVAHPDLVLARERFEARLATRTLPAAPRADDLFLAVACEEQHATALAKFEVEMIGRLRVLLRRVEADRELVDELVQVVRVRVLVGDGVPPRIASYTGAGSLLGWLRVMAVRLHANARRDRARAPIVTAPDELDDHAASLIAPERALLDGTYGPALRVALSAGLRSLEPRDRALLRFHYVDGIGLDRIGAMYGVHKATISRWLAAARDRLVESTLGKLDIEGTPTELFSLCRQVLDRLEVTLSALRVEVVDALP